VKVERSAIFNKFIEKKLKILSVDSTVPVHRMGYQLRQKRQAMKVSYCTFYLYWRNNTCLNCRSLGSRDRNQCLLIWENLYKTYWLTAGTVVLIPESVQIFSIFPEVWLASSTLYYSTTKSVSYIWDMTQNPCHFAVCNIKKQKKL
jgi:hypothetical protein